jgi:hypothetical protein
MEFKKGFLSKEVPMSDWKNKMERDFSWRADQVKRGAKKTFDSGRWKHYLPAVFSLLIAYVFFVAPFLAALILGGGLIFFGLLYAFAVYHMHKFADQKARFEEASEAYGNDPWYQDMDPHAEPTFRNVTIMMSRRGFGWWEKD